MTLSETIRRHELRQQNPAALGLPDTPRVREMISGLSAIVAAKKTIATVANNPALRADVESVCRSAGVRW